MSIKGKLKRLVEPLTGHWTAPGSPLRLRKPAGFESTEAFPGLIQPGGAASIMVQVLPAPYAEVTAGFEREGLLKRGMALHEDEPVDLDGRFGRLLRLSQGAHGMDFEKWTLLLDADGQTVIAMATFPATDALELSALLRSTLLEARFHDDSADARGAAFRLGESALLKPAGVWGGMTFYTPDGRFVPGQPGAALFIAGSGLRNVEGDDARRRFATEHLGQLDADLMGVSVTTQRPVTLDGLSGYESQAVGRSRGTGEPRVVYETLLFDQGRYVVLAGVASERDAATYVPAFQALVAGYRQ